MFLREKSRPKDGETHQYWSVVENRRVSGRRVVQRQVLYLVELNNHQWSEWIPTIEEFLDCREELQILACEAVRELLDRIGLSRPREWGACWLGLFVWNLQELETFW